jgi:pyruvate, water dikinase
MNLVPVPFGDCHEEDRFGGKVVSLAEASRAELSVPPGFGLEVELVNAVVAGNQHVIEQVQTAFRGMQTHVAVRSSAVGEDSSDASFAGQHDSIMNVTDARGLIDAIVQVYRSAHTESAYAYRKKVGVTADARIAVAMQAQIPSEKAGVMFTRNPVNGLEERYIEVAWGLGEAVVAGMVVPDTYRISAAGQVVERQIGEKDIKLELPDKGAGTIEVEVEEALIESPCLSDQELKELHELAIACEKTYGSGLDVEFAFYRAGLYLLQCRSITVVHKL